LLLGQLPLGQFLLGQLLLGLANLWGIALGGFCQHSHNLKQCATAAVTA
jgi:hypothetical protein